MSSIIERAFDETLYRLNRFNRCPTARTMDLANSPDKFFRCKSFQEAKEKMSQVSVYPGDVLFFLHKPDGYSHHTGIVPGIDGEMYSLDTVPLLQCIPPPLGKGLGPLAGNGQDISGIRLSAPLDFINWSSGNCGLLWGRPPVEEEFVKKAGQIAADVVQTGMINNKASVFSLNVAGIGNLAYIHYWGDVDDGGLIFGSTMRLRHEHKKKDYGIKPLYCGEMVVNILDLAGCDVPKVQVLGKKYPASTRTLRWFVENNSLKGGVLWE